MNKKLKLNLEKNELFFNFRSALEKSYFFLDFPDDQKFHLNYMADD